MKPAWIILAALAMALPLWIVGSPAMPDYPAHLATYWLVAGGSSQFYHVHWAFLPNLAGEVLIPLLSKIAGLEVAAKLFMTAAVAMWVIGPALIQRALHGRIGIASLFAALFAYNANFLWGFVNYYFAMGAALVFFAAWIASDKRPLHVLGFALAATALYFCHLFALATLFLLLASWEIGSRRYASIALVFAPAALCFFLLKPKGRADDGIAFNLATTILDRLEATIQHSFDNPAYVLLALLAVLLATGVWRGWIVLHRRMLAPLIVIALAAAFAPEWAMGGWAVDMRLPAVLGALLFASAEFRVERVQAMALAAAAVLAMAVNVALLARDWLSYDAQFAEFRAAARTLPKDKRLLTVLDGDAIGYRSDQPYWHMAEFAVIDAHAFTQLLFTTRDQHVVQLGSADQSIAAASAGQGSPPDIDELADLAAGRIDEDEDIRDVFPYLMRFQCRYDIAVVIHLNGPRAQVPAMLKLRHAGSFFSLYDVMRDPSCAS
jgi:hypothetical protein